MRPANNQAAQEENNPCLKEHNLSLKCLNDNNYKHDACEAHFENYKQCKAFWNKIKSERRRQGIRPTLPPLHMREQIKQEYFSQFK
ncbi:coiled-coil-helix-coiled-coil-helix domain-containing protein 7-like [Ctenocephalides felis]|uniref:coiled-coil-helix-coiled-coil-helix domain-containing protein 7-like n=1 Tax=Ctenocephalides felis TaxID=7515 RepID=UPI000E6E4F92|nr:coiled-coil-helix-coiled-coil-helix domain-containing protein 7-like [Ctenocephalides felis]XP_026462304.1 coiled-coil-helix-coiled-coil-helix domain-containing protein 7-like [Ctenocephalides felis]XP_026462355.1 coiled-coil-helix-coiled-coil-helix domain-containing protein 7-like [Ctenocephalides felis]